MMMDKGIKKSRQLIAYQKQRLEARKQATKVDVPTTSDDLVKSMLLTFNKATAIPNESWYYENAKKLFVALHRHLPSGVYRHFVMLMIEHDRKVNKYGDQI